MHARISVLALVAGLSLSGPALADADGDEQLSAGREIANLRTFARLYGYLRYFHPSDAAASADWSRLAIHGSSLVREAGDREQLAETLRGLFSPIAPTLVVYDPLEGHAPPALPLSEPSDPSDVVAWQHSGVRLAARAPYRSVRTNRMTDPGQNGAYGQFSQLIEPGITGDWPGRSVRLRAAMRADVEGDGNSGHLWLRVARPEGQKGLLIEMADRPITSADWEVYEISGEIDADATGLVFGALLRGVGQIWVDAFDLSVREDDGSWRSLALTNASFEQSGEVPAGWYAGADNYLFELSDTAAFDGERSLSVRSDPPVVPGAIFEVVPPPGYFVDKALGSGLRARVPVALTDADARTAGAGAETLADTLDGVPIEDLTAADADLRYADVVIAWNVLQHFYPYFDVIAADWDEVLGTALVDARDDRNPGDFEKTLARMINALEDGHGNTWYESAPQSVGLPVRMRWIEGRAVVTEAATPELELGDVIVKLDGRAVAELVDKEMELVSGSVRWQRFRALQRLSRGPEGSPAAITVERNGKTLEVMVTRDDASLPPPALDPLDTLDGGIRYVDLSRAEWSDIHASIHELAAAPGVIFDLRGYPNSNHDVLSHLTDEPLQSAIWNVPQVVYPDQDPVSGWDTSGRWLMSPRAPRIEGRVVFITDASAISYAESVMGIVEHYALGDIVGEATAGANGNVNYMDLPGGFRFVFTGMKVLKHDGSQHHLVGIRPTVPVERSIRGVRAGVDEQLEAAIGLISPELDGYAAARAGRE